MLKKTLKLSDNSYLYIFELLQNRKKELEGRIDITCYSEEELEERPWRVEEAKKAEHEMQNLKVVYQNFLFGDCE